MASIATDASVRRCPKSGLWLETDALLHHGKSRSPSPCSSRSRCSTSDDDNQSTAASENSWGVEEGQESPSTLSRTHSSDSSSDDEGCCNEDLGVVETHLAAMNTSGDEVNTLQQSLSKLEKQRADLRRRWRAESARMEKSIGIDRLARAKRVAEAESHCEAALEAVGITSKRYMEAVDAGITGEELASFMEEHALWLSEYQASKRQLMETRRFSSMSAEAVKAVMPYWIAKASHQTEVGRLNTNIAELERLLSDAKRRYRGAMHALETLSERIHQQRAPQKLTGVI